MADLMNMPSGCPLIVHLRSFSDAELAAMWSALKCKLEDEGFEHSLRERKVALISKEFRSVAGHTLVNIFRGPHDLSYNQILVDVADKLNPGLLWTDLKKDAPTSQLEQRVSEIVDSVVKLQWDKLSAEDRRKMVESMGEGMAKATKAQDSLVDAAKEKRIKDAVTTQTLATAIQAGLLTGGGMAILQSSLIGTVGGVIGASLFTQIGVWIVVQLFGWWAGLEFLLGGGAALLGGAVVALPAVVIGGGMTFMQPSYSKTIPATVVLLTAVNLAKKLKNADL